MSARAGRRGLSDAAPGAPRRHPSATTGRYGSPEVLADRCRAATPRRGARRVTTTDHSPATAHGRPPRPATR
ncbi:hypothetical protein FPZ47_09795 [Mycobacterium helveticum]|uniref:Uncharacterized protein n=1 Tax=Mycobacterium helveticum TaxID=2592811 RepID=A0A557XWB3_9MYCO|nr:hypothetical protein FPZ46_11830 [Mycobacterium helveticum]TVS90327.1 hypothetical protein FPZ47_09795 [Mycobacterium helveticum]